MKRVMSLILAIMMTAIFVVGCTSEKEVKTVDLKEIHNKIKETLGEDYIPNMELSVEDLENITGVKGENIEIAIAEVPMISVSVDTFIAIEAKEGKGDIVEEELENYRRFLVEESMQYPMNISKVNTAKVLRHGDYIFFVMLGKLDEREEATDEERLDFAKKEVEKVEEVINGFFK